MVKVITDLFLLLIILGKLSLILSISIPKLLYFFGIRFEANTFNEVVLKCPRPANEIRDALLEYKILAGLPLGDYYQELSDGLLICTTEMNTVEAIDDLAEKLSTI